MAEQINEPTMNAQQTHAHETTGQVQHTRARRERPKKRHSLIRSHRDVRPVIRQTLKEWHQPMVKKVEQLTGLDREKLFYIFCTFLTCWLIMGPGNDFLCNLIGVIYPAYQSVLAVRTKTKTDDTHWLIYWCSFALFTLFDFAVTSLTKARPIYLMVKTILLLYLALPQTYGAHNVYVNYVDPLVDWLDERFEKFSAETKEK